MTLHGRNLIGIETSAEGTDTFEATEPATGQPLGTIFHTATEGEIDRAVTQAQAASAAYSQVSPAQKAAFLERIAEELLALSDPVIEQAQQETALPQARLTSERLRTTGQLQMFARLVREGSWVDARIDRAMPDRKPAARPDLRRMLVPLGPVAVFGASNFPFAFSVAGGDTASALAAGCPVIVKAHPAHPGTSEMTAEAVRRAAAAAGMPDGVFSLLHGGADTSLALVRHPLLEAVGFTGSLRAGRALFDAAAARPRPIPVYSEMGSVNPVFVLPGALAERGPQIAAGLAQSVTLGVGQFCTNPGLVVSLGGVALTSWAKTAAAAVMQMPPSPMLSPGICHAYGEGIERLERSGAVRRVGNSSIAAEQTAAAAMFTVDAPAFLENPALAEEVFGPSTLLVACGAADEMKQVARGLEGQLTATVHGTTADFAEFRDLIEILETKVGRLVINGFPTGVEVSPAMQHGGPYPATTDSRSTSVGTAAIFRFARPLCRQDYPSALLPPELQDENPLGLWRLIDGAWTQEAVS